VVITIIWGEKMSLTSFVKIEEVSKKIDEAFIMPKVEIASDMLRYPPRTGNYDAIGTAFDYVMRVLV